jgi:hypothetical protein
VPAVQREIFVNKHLRRAGALFIHPSQMDLMTPRDYAFRWAPALCVFSGGKRAGARTGTAGAICRLDLAAVVTPPPAPPSCPGPPAVGGALSLPNLLAGDTALTLTQFFLRRIDSAIQTKPEPIPGESSEPYERDAFTILGRLFPHSLEESSLAA